MTVTTIHNKDNPIIRGIKTVGIGKKGSKALDATLVGEIMEDLSQTQVPLLQQGAFFGALMIKGLTETERALEKALPPGALNDPKILCRYLAYDAPDHIREICARLVENETLSLDSARELGRFLLSETPGDGARGLAASIMRVRYETDEEYQGLLEAIQETLEPPFRQDIPQGQPVIQLAEPFDGVDHSNLITPLIAQYLQTLDYRVVSLAGRNSGPKSGNNLFDLVQAMTVEFMTNSQQLANPNPPFGWYVNQQDMSKSLDRWVELRRAIIKRPFLATLERFVNPCRASIFIASAFHPPYGEKMLEVCERAGYPAAIVVRNGLEGTIAFPLKRNVKILCSVRQENKKYLRNEIDFSPEQFLNTTVPIEEKLDHPILEKNKELILRHDQEGRSGYELFDLRVKATRAGLTQAVRWIETFSNFKTMV